MICGRLGGEEHQIMKRNLLHGMWFGVFAFNLFLGGISSAETWKEETFYSKAIIVARPFTLPQSPKAMQAQTIVGSPREY